MEDSGQDHFKLQSTGVGVLFRDPYLHIVGMLHVYVDHAVTILTDWSSQIFPILYHTLITSFTNLLQQNS